MNNKIKNIISESIKLKSQLLNDEIFIKKIQTVSELLTTSLQDGGKVLFCGNGGSASDAQHLAAELSGRFYLERNPLFAEALHVNSSFLTAVANDYSFDEIYARMIRAKGRKGDVLMGISTSGNSPNIIRALQQARTQGISTVGMTGKSGGAVKAYCDHLLNIPSDDTPRIQECHILIGHIICEIVEKNMYESEER